MVSTKCLIQKDLKFQIFFVYWDKKPLLLAVDYLVSVSEPIWDHLPQAIQLLYQYSLFFSFDGFIFSSIFVYSLLIPLYFLEQHFSKGGLLDWLPVHMWWSTCSRQIPWARHTQVPKRLRISGERAKVYLFNTPQLILMHTKA